MVAVVDGRGRVGSWKVAATSSEIADRGGVKHEV